MDKIDLSTYSANSLLNLYAILTGAWYAGGENSEELDAIQDIRNAVYIKLNVQGLGPQAEQIDNSVKQNLPGNGGS